MEGRRPSTAHKHIHMFYKKELARSKASCAAVCTCHAHRRYQNMHLDDAAVPALQEVITAVKLKLHITVLVLNDNAYGVRCSEYDFVESGVRV